MNLTEKQKEALKIINNFFKKEVDVSKSISKYGDKLDEMEICLILEQTYSFTYPDNVFFEATNKGFLPINSSIYSLLTYIK